MEQSQSFYLSEVVSALSHALDLTEGQPAGHAQRSCMIGMRIAEVVGLPAAERSALFYTLLLKDTGCSGNASRLAALFETDDRRVKHRFKLVDWSNRTEMALFSLRHAASGGSLAEKVRVLRGLAASNINHTRDSLRMRCDRGALIVRQLGFPEATALGIRSLDEHWDGSGYPDGLKGEAIPQLSRIALLAQTIDVFLTDRGRQGALRVIRARSGTWFDPALVEAVLSFAGDLPWWESLSSPKLPVMVLAAEPADRAMPLTEEDLDRVAETFADIIDAKTPFTYRHSSGVAAYAQAIARAMGLDGAQQRRLYRAGLLHDIGKLGISNRILEKPGQLTPEERAEVERHPLYTWEILSRISAFQDFAWMASLHHERLDGTGYPFRESGPNLDLPARILAVADIYEALTAARPYRQGMPVEQALAILREEAALGHLDRGAVEALASLLVRT